MNPRAGASKSNRSEARPLASPFAGIEVDKVLRPTARLVVRRDRQMLSIDIQTVDRTARLKKRRLNWSAVGFV